MRLALAALLLLSAAPAFAEEYGCEGVFNADATLADIEAVFGKENVVTGEVPGPEGTTMIATTINPGDTVNEFQVRWWDEENTARLAGVTIPLGHSGPGGVQVGMPIEEVEAINGEAFGLFGFYWDYGGSAGFESGALSALPGGCHLNLRLAPTAETLTEAQVAAISGDIELRSDQPEIRAAGVEVWEVNLGYPYPEDPEDASGTTGD